jgi:hypothetical protein
MCLGLPPDPGLPVLQVIDVLGGRLKNRDEAANIGVCTNLLQSMVPSALKDVDFVKVHTWAFFFPFRCLPGTE